MERFRLGFTVRVRVKVVRVSLPFWPPKPRVFPLVVLFWFPGPPPCPWAVFFPSLPFG